ncbi:MAG: cysteine desulfurase [Ruminococcaceae bacterium]|nr:cysteine desulfurase [Oscillospiraceae bacterium]
MLYILKWERITLAIYLDNSATTPLCESAKKKIAYMLDECWANPSSIHHLGVRAKDELDNARKIIAEKISAREDEVYFTSGGTESNNIAIFGAVQKLRKRGNKIITSSVEHPSVENCMKALETQGFNVVRLPVDKSGKINIQDLIKEVDEKTILVSIMFVNNESGAINPIQLIRKAVLMKNSPALIHCDAVQAFGKMPIKVQKLGVDLMSISSHKIHGPKGAGALFVRKGVNIVSPVSGGGQEKGLRSGTEAMPAICGFAAAAEEITEIEKNLENVKFLRDNFVEKLKSIDSVVINSAHDALPYIVNFSVVGIPSQPMINFLSEREIYVSGGSACAKGHRSTALVNAGLTPERIDSAIRVSLSKYNTVEELELTAENIALAVKMLRRV